MTLFRPPLPPPGSHRSSFPLPSSTTRLESPAARRATQHTDSCDWLTTKGAKMEHRDADFNIMLATDSYKVPCRWPFEADGETGWRGAADGWKFIEVKVVSSSVPRPSYCSLWPVPVGSERAEREEERGWYSRGGGIKFSEHPCLS